MTKACFEISWEVANAVGGIHTVIASKAEQMKKIYGERYFVIGPWLPDQHIHQARVFDERSLEPLAMHALEEMKNIGLNFKTGRWNVPGNPFCLLIDFSHLWHEKDKILGDYWERYGLDSFNGGHDYEEPVLFGISAAIIVERLSREWLIPSGFEVVLSAHEWLSASAILHVKHSCPELATVFTTHATALGRSLSSRTHLPENDLDEGEARTLAKEYGILAKHSMEWVAARVSDVFTTVSETTAIECKRILGVRPAVLLPNALAEDYPSKELRKVEFRKKARNDLYAIASQTIGCSYSGSLIDEPIILLTSGRYEFRNKGLDIFTEALGLVQSSLGVVRMPQVLVFYLVPADSEMDQPTAEPRARLLTHELKNFDTDPLLNAFENAGLKNDLHSSVHVVWVPKFLDGTDERIPSTYFELLAGADLTVFPSWYEPWGYTPMESIALGIPTVTSDMTGFAYWATLFGDADDTGVFRIQRRARTHRESVEALAEIIFKAIRRGRTWLSGFEAPASSLSKRGTWNTAISFYLEAHQKAFKRVQEEKVIRSKPCNFDSAYFSMEFAVKSDLFIYSGGLGVLAGDFLKAAQDLGRRVCGIGLAYREGYFRQKISEDLNQEVHPAEHASFGKNGLKHILDEHGNPLVFGIPFVGYGQILCCAWKLDLGSSQLLLLDTDVEANPIELRRLASRLYTSDRRERWLQEYFLGTAGIKLLKWLDIRPKWFHQNEGHTALLSFERMKNLIEERHLNFHEALLEVRKTTLFTTHTPVPAGHEEFGRDCSFPEIQLIANNLRVHSNRICELGHSARDCVDRFSMTTLALHSSNKVNAVSQRHRLAAERSFDRLTYSHHYLFSITNGVHPQTWLSPEWQAFISKKLGHDWIRHLDDPGWWTKVADIPDNEIWNLHIQNKKALHRRIQDSILKSGVVKSRESAVNSVLSTLKLDPMLAVFARRFTAYKRPDLLFMDKARLRNLLIRYPKTVFIFAGKAHPADGQGHALVHHILKMESSDEFKGRVLFLENYGMVDAQHLVSGADLWINFPQQPLEASGTSGMKAGMNGVLNLSVSDGWVPEAKHGEVPWKIGSGSETFEKPMMDWIHAQELYAYLEREVMPSFWDRTSDGIPVSWVRLMKKSIASTIPRFSAQRMVGEYAEKMQWH